MLRKGPAPRRSESSKRVAKQQRRVVSAELVCARQGEPGLANRLDLERKVDQRPILVRPSDRADAERLHRASAEDDPFPTAGADEAPGGVWRIDGANQWGGISNVRWIPLWYVTGFPVRARRHSRRYASAKPATSETNSVL